MRERDGEKVRWRDIDHGMILEGRSRWPRREREKVTKTQRQRRETEITDIKEDRKIEHRDRRG